MTVSTNDSNGEAVAAPAQNDVTSEQKRRYLVATKLGPNALGFSPQATLELLEKVLDQDPEIDVVRKLKPRGMVAALSAGVLGPSQVIVARMADEKAAQLRATGEPRGVLVEIDHPLAMAAPFDGPIGADHETLSPLDIAALGPVGSALRLTLSVVDQGGNPVSNAQVMLYGSGFPAQASTDANGMAELVLPGNTVNTISALYVKPVADSWNLYIERPLLNTNAVNRVQLQPLGELQQGWGFRAMNLDKLPANISGRGVTVAVIDSGVASGHPLLTRVTQGSDITDPSNADGWKNDVVMHGTHCAGVIGGQAADVALRGVAPAANMIAIKIFPGGHFSDLIDAIDVAISHQVDVVNMSLGSDQPSEIIDNKLAQAKALGIACIVAAGNSGGPVQHPARSPDVLAVAAIGKLDEFPPGTYHAKQVSGDPRSFGPQGYFHARFSCVGKEIAVCGPGVAIISAVPPGNYAAWDGTSMATPHVAGLAALLLAHHPDFAGTYKQRNLARVDRLFQILRESAQSIPGANAQQVGVGLPDAQRAFGLVAAAAGPSPSPQPDVLLAELRRILANLQSSLHQGPTGGLPLMPASVQPFAPPAPYPSWSLTEVLARMNNHPTPSERTHVQGVLNELRTRLQQVALSPLR